MFKSVSGNSSPARIQITNHTANPIAQVNISVIEGNKPKHVLGADLPIAKIGLSCDGKKDVNLATLFASTHVSGQFDVKVSLKVEGKLLTKTFRDLSKEKWLDFEISKGEAPSKPSRLLQFFLWLFRIIVSTPNETTPFSIRMKKGVKNTDLSPLREIENYKPHALTKVTAENFSDRKINQIDVYAPGVKNASFLRTDLPPHAEVKTIRGNYINSSTFFSSIRANRPYTLKAIAVRDEKKLSGRIEVKNDGKLRIEFHGHASTMNLYTMDGKTLLDSVALTPTPKHLS